MNPKKKEVKDSTMVAIIIGLLVVMVVLGFFIFRFPKEEERRAGEERVASEDKENNDEEISFDERKEKVLSDFIGKMHESNPLDEDNLYNKEGFNSTTLILSVAAKANSEDEDPREEMKHVNYHPPGEVSYENRLHFSSYRNEVSDYFEDITKEVGGDHVSKKSVVLNKEYEEGERLIDIDWEKDMDLYYVPSEYVIDVMRDLPTFVGAMFIKEGDDVIGLDVRSEGIVVEQSDIVHASSKEGKVVRGSFLDHIDEADFHGVIFFEFNEVK